MVVVLEIAPEIGAQGREAEYRGAREGGAIALLQDGLVDALDAAVAPGPAGTDARMAAWASAWVKVALVNSLGWSVLSGSLQLGRRLLARRRARFEASPAPRGVAAGTGSAVAAV